MDYEINNSNRPRFFCVHKSKKYVILLTYILCLWNDTELGFEVTSVFCWHFQQIQIQLCNERGYDENAHFAKLLWALG